MGNKWTYVWLQEKSKTKSPRYASESEKNAWPRLEASTKDLHQFIRRRREQRSIATDAKWFKYSQITPSYWECKKPVLWKIVYRSASDPEASFQTSFDVCRIDRNPAVGMLWNWSGLIFSFYEPARDVSRLVQPPPLIHVMVSTLVLRHSNVGCVIVFSRHSGTPELT